MFVIIWGVDLQPHMSYITEIQGAVVVYQYTMCQHFLQKFVTIVLTFSLKIILRQFLSPFQKDYLTTNFNLTTTITLTIKILS